MLLCVQGMCALVLIDSLIRTDMVYRFYALSFYVFMTVHSGRFSGEGSWGSMKKSLKYTAFAVAHLSYICTAHFAQSGCGFREFCDPSMVHKM